MPKTIIESSCRSKIISERNVELSHVGQLGRDCGGIAKKSQLCIIQRQSWFCKSFHKIGFPALHCNALVMYTCFHLLPSCQAETKIGFHIFSIRWDICGSAPMSLRRANGIVIRFRKGSIYSLGKVLQNVLYVGESWPTVNWWFLTGSNLLVHRRKVNRCLFLFLIFKRVECVQVMTLQ